MVFQSDLTQKTGTSKNNMKIALFHALRGMGMFKILKLNVDSSVKPP